MDDQGNPAFERIVAQFTAAHADVVAGKMMSAPGLKCNDKVFAFHTKDGMGFRLGPTFDPKAYGLREAAPLNPFKTKGPLKGWYVVNANEIDQWEGLAEQALAFTRTL
ncbi:MAG: hypothetical protein GKS00_29530 [Alphaproteobacteria bacterium]|nr:hypothetical protein [Alphaproteobacteria bacterium]